MQNNYIINQYKNLHKNQSNHHNVLVREQTLEQTQYAEQMKQLQQQKLMQQMQSKIKEYTKNLLEPTKINEDNSGVKEAFLQKEQEFKQVQQINNLPYKQIMFNPKYGGEDYKKKHNKETFEEDVCVHKVSDADKLHVDEDFQKLKDTIVEHDDTLKKIYSLEHENQHKTKFEYRKSDVYRVKYNGSNSVDLKQDKLKSLEKQQKEWEKERIKTKNIIKDIEILNELQIESVMNNIVSN